jgi:hypothetical protein
MVTVGASTDAGGRQQLPSPRVYILGVHVLFRMRFSHAPCWY